MTANDDHWPSLPPIRTTSYNSRVSCETLNLHISSVAASASARSTSNTTSSASLRPKSASKSADASPFFSETTSPSRTFSCFPHKFSKAHGQDRKKGGAQAHAGGFDATGLLRSIFGFSSPMVSFTSGASPSNWQSPQANWQTPPSMTTSPSGRTSPIKPMRSSGATPHPGVLLRSSKGHAAHMHAFTMMPPDVVGRKKPAGYESDEPTSPEVTCIGKVRRKHCKATWGALVKEKNKDAKKNGKAKNLSEEMPPNSDFNIFGKKGDGREAIATAQLSRQKSETRRSLDFEGFLTDFDMCLPRHGDSAKNDFIQGVDDGICCQAPPESRTGDAQTHASRDCGGQDSAWSLCDKRAELDEPALSSETLPPSNCLLLMKKGSRNRSAHYCSDEQLAHEPWNLGQVLT